MPKKSTHTPIRQFRLGTETDELIDYLAAHYGGLSRTDVIRLAVRELADRVPSEVRRKNPKKTPGPS
jgi:hypothetical protein